MTTATGQAGQVKQKSNLQARGIGRLASRSPKVMSSSWSITSCLRESLTFDPREVLLFCDGVDMQHHGQGIDVLGLHILID